jgi:hypothetical protein
LNVTYYQFSVNCLTSRKEQALGLPNNELSCRPDGSHASTIHRTILAVRLGIWAVNSNVMLGNSPMMAWRNTEMNKK